jgi:hypothetical protein
MTISDDEMDRWLERGGKLFKTLARNPMVRGTLRGRGLTDAELGKGWQLYSELNGFGVESAAQAATSQTVAAQALNELDAWDALAHLGWWTRRDGRTRCADRPSLKAAPPSSLPEREKRWQKE